MKKYEVSEEFIREAFEAACETWKGKIKKEFPELFEPIYQVGKWYTYKNIGDVIYCITKIDDKKIYAFGRDYSGSWWDDGEWADAKLDPNRELATKEEIEEMLWKEAEKRGIKKDTKIEKRLHESPRSTNYGIFTACYQEKKDRLWNFNGVVYDKGKWATPLNENKEIQDKIDSLQKQLDELKSKVK